MLFNASKYLHVAHQFPMQPHAIHNPHIAANYIIIAIHLLRIAGFPVFTQLAQAFKINVMNRIIIILLLAFTSASAAAQLSKSVTEDKPIVADGIEYGYAIKNSGTREVNKKDFSRYEVTLYATNKDLKVISAKVSIWLVVNVK